MGLQDHEFDIAPEGVLGLVAPFGAATEDRLRGLEDEVGAVTARLRNAMGSIAGTRDLNRAGMTHGVSGTGSISNGNAQGNDIGSGHVGRAGFGGFVIGGGFVGVGPDPIVDRGQGGGWAGDPGPAASEAAARAGTLNERVHHASIARNRAEVTGNAGDALEASVLESKAKDAQSAYQQAVIEWARIANIGSIPFKGKLSTPDPDGETPSSRPSVLDVLRFFGWLPSHGGLIAPQESDGAGGFRGHWSDAVTDPDPNDSSGGDGGGLVPLWQLLLIDPPPQSL